jgi:hypothetical protein
VLRTRIAEFVAAGEFGLASGFDPTGDYRMGWFVEDIDPIEFAFEADVSLLTKTAAARLKSADVTPIPVPEPTPPHGPALPEEPVGPAEPPTSNRSVLINVSGKIPPSNGTGLAQG